MTLTCDATHERKSDEQLARESVAGCSRSFACLVERYEGRLLRFVRRWASSEHDAEDIAQDAFVEAWRCLHRYDDRWRFSTWLYTIASRRAVSYVRRKKPIASDTIEHGEDEHAQRPMQAMEAGETRTRVWDVAERLLTEEQRTALWLKYAEGMNAKEIGRVLGRQQVAVRVMLFRARERLAAELASESDDRPNMDADGDLKSLSLEAARTGDRSERRYSTRPKRTLVG